MTLSGANSQWINDQILTIGQNGDATLIGGQCEDRIGHGTHRVGDEHLLSQSQAEAGHAACDVVEVRRSSRDQRNSLAAGAIPEVATR